MTKIFGESLGNEYQKNKVARAGSGISAREWVRFSRFIQWVGASGLQDSYYFES